MFLFLLDFFTGRFKDVKYKLNCPDCFKDVEYKLNCPDESSYKAEDLASLIKTLTKITKAKYHQIVVKEIKKGCVSVSFMISNRIIPVLRSLYMSDNLHKTLRRMSSLKHTVLKVTIQDDIIYTYSMYCLIFYNMHCYEWRICYGN